MMRPTDRQQERGMAAVFTVLGFLALTLVVGMSTDFGILMRYRRAMQNACDSGALAGGLSLRSSPSTAPATAQRYAEDDMRQNNIAWSSVDATTLDLSATLPGVDSVRVVIHSVVPMFFLRLVRDSVPVAVACTARLTPVILTEGLVPMGVDYGDPSSPGFDPSCAATRTCSWGYLYDPTRADSPCAPYVYLPLTDPGRPDICRSFPITADISNHSDLWGNGNTGLLNMSCFNCSGGGASAWRDFFINGAPTQFCYDVNHTTAVSDYTVDGQQCANVMTQPGVAIGAIRPGVENRCSSPPPPDSFRRIIMMPLLNHGSVAQTQGRRTTEIWGFVAFQIDCSGSRITGNNPTIAGGFVSIVSMQAVGRETTFDTGVYTIRLVE